MKIPNYPLTFIRKIATKCALIGCAMTASTEVCADVRVAVFADARGFHALMSGDLEQANKVLPAFTLRSFDYADANNLCVLQILQENQADAVQTCGAALTKIAATSMKRTARRQFTAEIYANLAAAQMLEGDYPGAQRSLDKALRLSKTADKADSNAAKNQQVLRSRLLAAN